MSLLVMKFGGTSVGNAAAISALAAISRDHLQEWDHVAVVVSAMSGVTDLLLGGASSAASGDQTTYKRTAATRRDKHAAALAELVPDADAATATRAAIEQLIDEFEVLCHSVGVLGEASPRAIDAIASMGERMSVRLVAAALGAQGTPCLLYTSA
ncbi:aspartate kinase, partial [Kouleothrix aurantiaca]